MPGALCAGVRWHSDCLLRVCIAHCFDIAARGALARLSAGDFRVAGGVVGIVLSLSCAVSSCNPQELVILLATTPVGSHALPVSQAGVCLTSGSSELCLRKHVPALPELHSSLASACAARCSLTRVLAAAARLEVRGGLLGTSSCCRSASRSCSVAAAACWSVSARLAAKVATCKVNWQFKCLEQ